MTYVEWLRVVKTLKRTAIVLGALVVIAAIARILLSLYGPVDAMSFSRSLENDPAAHITTRTLPGGGVEKTIDDPNGVRAVVTDYGNGRKTVHISSTAGSMKRPFGLYGDGSMRHTRNGDRSDVVVETHADNGESFASEFGFAGLVALIVGMILAGCFARENDGHLEIALTKPISRVTLAARIMLIDLAGIAIAWALAVIAFELVHCIFFGLAGSQITGRDVLLAIVVLLGAAAWYAVLCCATASLKRNYGIILGAAWIVAWAIPLLASIDPNEPVPFLVLRSIAIPLSWIDPFTYARVAIGAPSIAQTFHVLPYGIEIPVLTALTVAYAALAIVQWRRVEA